MWFADKLGPVPKDSARGQAEPQKTVAAPAPTARSSAPAASNRAAAPPQQAARPQAAAAPQASVEPPKKKKGWF